MATKPEAGADAAKPAKSKKMLIIIIGVVLLLVLGGGGAFFMISKQRAAAAADEEGGAEPAAHAPAAHDAAKTPPVYLPMDNMVVNLADPGGERVAQVGITLEVRDVHAVDTVKAYMPTIRSGVLMLLSQRAADDLLSPEGKQKLIDDILVECSRPFGGGEPEPEPVPGKKVRKKAPVDYPVVAVLFSSLIVQ
ncbi:flagellar basal body-associated FliL family protein [Rhodoferax sp. U11-2br]|uniref:flagellar basal body-associated FliL family protein n=1 Tax=Rhodoferax sp. U11-2br TaxID=2838878 RepID=UPI00352FDC98